MNLEGVIHCNGPGCECHQHVGVASMSLQRLPAGWIKIIEYGDQEPVLTAYCNWECVLKTAAAIPPPTEISFTDFE